MSPEEILEHGDVLGIEEGDIVVLRGARISAEALERLRETINRNFLVITIPRDASVGVLRSEALRALEEKP